jgi:NTE family protein
VTNDPLNVPAGPAEPAHPSAQEAWLDHSLQGLFGPLDPRSRALLHAQLQWVELEAGEVLMRQGEPGDALYIVVSGRLQVWMRDAEGRQQLWRELGRSQVVGELSLFTDAPRSASVVALRHAVLARLDRAGLRQLQAAAWPLYDALARHAIQRLQTPPQRAADSRPVVMALLAITAGVDLPAQTAQLAAALAALQVDGHPARVEVVTAQRAQAAAEAAPQDIPTLATPTASLPATDSDAAGRARRQISLWLDQLEAQADFVLLQADDSAAATSPSTWTARCCNLADELLLLADATQPAQLHPLETQLLQARRWALDEPPPAEQGPAQRLLLLHPAAATMPRGTAAWLARRPVNAHLHLRRGHAGDLARLARLLAGQATGLVLAGGGARGLAHLGVWRALQEAGIEIDVVGGTSIGAVMAVLLAADQPLPQVMALARSGFSSNPTGDYNWLPQISLIRGRKLRRLVDSAMDGLAGPGAGFEDLWKPCYCIVANYSQAREDVVTRGPLTRLMRASLSIPGALPPVLHEGDLLCDGGTFNNFPVDVMRRWRGVQRVIGVDLSVHKPRRFDFDEIPSNWALLRDRLRPYAQRRWRLPSLLAYLLNVTILYSSSRRQQAAQLTDLLLRPPLERVGMLQWRRFDQIVEQGYAYARQRLAADAPAKPPSPA